MDIFRDEQDYLAFLRRLRIVLGRMNGYRPARGMQIQPFDRNAFSLVTYCLMPNHFHLQLKQCADVPASKLILKVCTSYSMYFNKKYDHVGHVFQDQFKAVRIDSDNQAAAVSAYIHQNPLVAKLTDHPDAWVYSSYPEYQGTRNGDLVDQEELLAQFADREAYLDFVEQQYEGIMERKEIEALTLD